GIKPPDDYQPKLLGAAGFEILRASASRSEVLPVSRHDVRVVRVVLAMLQKAAFLRRTKAPVMSAVQKRLLWRLGLNCVRPLPVHIASALIAVLVNARKDQDTLLQWARDAASRPPTPEQAALLTANNVDPAKWKNTLAAAKQIEELRLVNDGAASPFSGSSAAAAFDGQRKGPKKPTEKQLKLLERIGVRGRSIPTSSGEASALLTKKFPKDTEYRRRRRGFKPPDEDQPRLLGAVGLSLRPDSDVYPVKRPLSRHEVRAILVVLAMLRMAESDEAIPFMGRNERCRLWYLGLNCVRPLPVHIASALIAVLVNARKDLDTLLESARDAASQRPTEKQAAVLKANNVDPALWDNLLAAEREISKLGPKKYMGQQP
ncbi:hypothetical protein Agub_g4255, partial [Astrephomene gubernaculifera]